MSQTDEPTRGDLDDRLMDQALRELLGGERPTDLTAKILAAAENLNELSPQRKEKVMDKPKRGRRSVVLGALAVCLFVGVTLALLLPATQSAREYSPAVARRNDARQLARSAPMSERTNESAPSDLRYQPGRQARQSTGKEIAPRRDQPVGLEAPRELAHDLHIKAAQSAAPTGQPSPYYMSDDVQYTLPPNSAAMPVATPAPGKSSSQLPAQQGQPSASSAPARPAANAAGVYSADLDVPFKAVPSVQRMVKPRVVIQEEEEKLSEYGGTSPSGQGPGRGGDKYDRLVENPFRLVKDHPLSTFSIDVDTASYANVRRFLLEEGQLPPPDAVRIEELVNYFDYSYQGPTDDVPFASHIEVAQCPWKEGHRLVRVGLKGKEVNNEQRPESNLVFLLDVSGSMDSPDKLPLLKEGMKLLAGQMRENDRVAIVVYASAEGLALPSTSGANRQRIVDALDQLQAGGSTAGGAGIELAYRIAQDNFIPGGVNRVLLCTDGDFNVGATSTAALERMVEEKAKSGVFLSVLGFGRGNLNDAMMETISNKGNGNYNYIDGITEARKVLVQQMGGTLVTIAKDVKIQIEFNPAQVAAYRLIGYENRMLAAEDFNDDKKDAGEIGAGHTVTALYEVVPAGMEVDVPSVDRLKYQPPAAQTDDDKANKELLTLKLRYKQPDGDTSKLLEFPVTDSEQRFGQASADFQFAASVASFGMLLRGSEHKGAAVYDAVLEMASASKGADAHGYRAEFLEMVRRAKAVAAR